MHTTCRISLLSVWGPTPRDCHSQRRSYIFQENSIAYNYILKQNSNARIYFTRTASRVYNFSRTALPLYTPEQNSNVCLYTHPGMGDLWEWRPLGLAARHPIIMFTFKVKPFGVLSCSHFKLAGRNIVAIVFASIAAYIFLEHNMRPFTITGYIPPGIPPFRPPPFTVTDPKKNVTYTLSDMSNVSYQFISIHSFIHSGHFYSAPSSLPLLRGAPDYSTDTVSEFHAEAHRQL